MKRWQGFFQKELPKTLEAMQIEVSSCCNLQCTFCPAACLNGDEGEKELMHPDVFGKLQPYFKETKWVYLQGWGEPLLNENIWEMVRLVKEAGAKAGFTTNGTLINAIAVNNLLACQVDLISISIAGGTGQVHEGLRVNSKLQYIVNNLELLIKEKKNRGSSFPLISISYMLTKESIADLLLAVKAAYELGVNDFYTTNLDYVFSEETNNNKVFVWGKKPLPEYENYIKEAANFARSKNFAFRAYPISTGEEMAVCDLNPARMVFITSNGDVTPCTYLGRKVNPRYSPEGLKAWPRKVFGNINSKDFSEIWHESEYLDFRNRFVLRAKAYEDLIVSYTGEGRSWFKIKNAEENYLKKIEENPLPEECRWCPKILGI